MVSWNLEGCFKIQLNHVNMFLMSNKFYFLVRLKSPWLFRGTRVKDFSDFCPGPESRKFWIWVPVPVPDYRERDRGIPGILSRMPTPAWDWPVLSRSHLKRIEAENDGETRTQKSDMTSEHKKSMFRLDKISMRLAFPWISCSTGLGLMLLFRKWGEFLNEEMSLAEIRTVNAKQTG